MLEQRHRHDIDLAKNNLTDTCSSFLQVEQVAFGASDQTFSGWQGRK